jgi:cyclic beta-1,2-glucan synthetase
LLGESGSESELGRLGGVHIIRGDDVQDEERVRLRTLAAFRLDASLGSLRKQISTGRATTEQLPPGSFSIPGPPPTLSSPGGQDEALPANGSEVLLAPSALGGFDPQSAEYVIDLPPGRGTPAPWTNVIAREEIGFLITEAGGSFTWAGDAGEYRLTPWHNDPVMGLRGEVVYLKDEDTGEVWTPSTGPLGRTRAHRIRHGFGGTTLQAEDRGLAEEVTWCLHPDFPVKVVRVRLTNRGDAPRRVSVTFFADWVLGTHPAKTAGRMQVRFDSEFSAIVARNPYLLKFSERIAFLSSDRFPDGMATDRSEFLGPSQPLDRVPDGLRRDVVGERRSPRGPGCGVLKRVLTLAPGEEGDVTFYLGAVDGTTALQNVLQALRPTDGSQDLARESRSGWRTYLDRVRVRTPEPGLDCIMNGWLPYQAITSRLRARTGFYQSSGAFGFRDQLQDVYTLLPLDPTLAIEQLTEAAQRQFPGGDVLHWWHPGTTRGVRTRCSDDLLWLPWVLAQTVRWTGDAALLDRRVPFLEGEPLPNDVHELYDAYSVTSEEATLWEHGLRSVGRVASLLSPRGLPLMGAGDWNDGMDRVGRDGRGESIWLGWFFVDVCRLLIPLAQARSEDRVVLQLEDWIATVREAIEAHGWDGEWYRRAYFDTGEPLGSKDSVEARIDSIAQSWAVISEAADPVRARQALDSAWNELVSPSEGIVRLLTPPFTGVGPDPGYIAAYPPGVRENGGQYTHAAAWLMRAFARAGDGDRAGQLLNTILPTRHAIGETGLSRYRVEPYVIAADVYGGEQHGGRGGWTWYTGSAGWVWRVVIEDILGVRREGSFLRVEPCIPSRWDGFELEIQVEEVRVTVRVTNPERRSTGIRSCTVDGIEVDPGRVRVLDDEQKAEGRPEGSRSEMTVDVILGDPAHPSHRNPAGAFSRLT